MQLLLSEYVMQILLSDYVLQLLLLLYLLLMYLLMRYYEYVLQERCKYDCVMP